MATPEKIGKYQVTGKLGQGAMGEVFRAHDPVLNRDVAIKRISAGLDADETVRKRFMREAQAVALLNHPHILAIYELGFEGDQMFMAMELLEGQDLKQAIAQRRASMSLDEKLGLMEQIAEGLAYAHARELVHRDLKPANIHILPGDKVKIMDFGLARMAGSDMTSTGTVMGTPHYMSPEQVRGIKADARSDVFALGCVFYELLSGHKPFDAESMHGVLFKVMQEEPPPMVEFVPDLPAMLVQLIERALAKDPAERFQNAGEMLAALRQTRAAVAGGRAHGEHDRGSVVHSAAPRSAARSASDRGSRVARQTRPPVKSGGGGRPLLIGAVVGLVVVAAAGFGVSRYLAGRQAPAASQAPQVRNLAQAVIDTQIELARRRLEAGDFADAARKAEGALKLDPSNAAAQQVLDAASEAQKKVEAAVTAIEAAGSDRDRLAAAALELMTVDPGHPEAQKAATAAGAAFRSRAEQARALEREQRQEAERAGANRSSAFARGIDLEKQGDRALEAGQLPTAARRFLEAKSRFEDARAGSR